MSMKQQWVVACDYVGCNALLTFPIGWERWEVGESTNDASWYAAPNDKQTFCPEHWNYE